MDGGNPGNTVTKMRDARLFISGMRRVARTLLDDKARVGVRIGRSSPQPLLPSGGLHIGVCSLPLSTRSVPCQARTPFEIQLSQ